MSFSDQFKQEIFIERNGRCDGCDQRLMGIWRHGGFPERPKLTFTILGANLHHILRKENEDSELMENIEMLCIPCHKRVHGGKSKKTYKELAVQDINSALYSSWIACYA